MGLIQTKRIIRVFIDTSALYAAMVSHTGAARELLYAWFRGRCELYLSALVVAEIERNLQAKAPELLPFFRAFQSIPSLYVVEPSRPLIERAVRIVVPKDAPIVAAAAECKAEYLATFDRVHILSRKHKILAEFGVLTVLPGDVLAALRAADL